MSLKDQIQGQAAALFSVVSGAPYVAPECMGDRWETLAELAKGLMKLADGLDAVPKTPEQKLAELRAALGVPESDDHEEACSYARDQASQARRYRDVRDIVGDSEVPF
jgi:hypothetical protein